MAVSRRKFIASVAAGSALAAVSGTEFVSALTNAASAASPVGDVVGKITVGYQGWFACIGDGAPINGWWHWSQNWAQTPSPSNNVIKAWPDMAEYTAKYQTAYSNFNNGSPATLFSSYDQQTVNTHFLWMAQNGCDTAALQRFNPNSSEGPTRDAMAQKVRTAAEANGRKFYIMYDVTGWTNMQTEIKTDWTSKMSAHTASPAYAKQNGKPVVCIWGFGLQRRQPQLHGRAVPRRHQLVQEPGLLRDRRRTARVAHRRRRLPAGLLRRLPRDEHDLAVDGRRDRQHRRLRQRLQPVQRG